MSRDTRLFPLLAREVNKTLGNSFLTTLEFSLKEDLSLLLGLLSIELLDVFLALLDVLFRLSSGYCL